MLLGESNQILMRIVTHTTIFAKARSVSNTNCFTPDHGGDSLLHTYAKSMDTRLSELI